MRGGTSSLCVRTHWCATLFQPPATYLVCPTGCFVHVRKCFVRLRTPVPSTPRSWVSRRTSRLRPAGIALWRSVSRDGLRAAAARLVHRRSWHRSVPSRWRALQCSSEWSPRRPESACPRPGCDAGWRAVLGLVLLGRAVQAEASACVLSHALEPECQVCAWSGSSAFHESVVPPPQRPSRLVEFQPLVASQWAARFSLHVSSVSFWCRCCACGSQWLRLQDVAQD